jgi:predicted GIY-YIG superfamily endonuclease
LKYFEKVKTKGIALKREFELKGLNREEKAKLIS